VCASSTLLYPLAFHSVTRNPQWLSVRTQVWRREVPVDEFADSDADRYVSEGLSAFCDPLVDVLDEFEQQLQLNKQRLLTSIEKMQKAHDDYEYSRQMEHQFVL